MKRIISIVLIIIIVLSVLLTGVLLILRNELREEKLKMRIREIAAENGYGIDMDGIGYNIGFSGFTAYVTDITIESALFRLKAERIYMDLDIWLLFRKQIRFRSININNFDLLVFKYKKKAETDTPASNLEFSSSIRLNNGTAAYDTLAIDIKSGILSVYNENGLYAKGIIKFNTDLQYIRELGDIKTEFSISFKDGLRIHEAEISNSNIYALIKGGIDSISADYDIYADVADINLVRKYISIDDSIQFEGALTGHAEGEYCFNEGLEYNILNADSITAELKGNAELFKHIFSTESISVQKDSTQLNFTGKLSADSFNTELRGNIDIAPLFSDTLAISAETEKLDAGILSLIINQFSLQGEVAVSVRIESPFDSILNLIYLERSVNAELKSDRLNLTYDTFNVVLSDIQAEISSDTVRGTINGVYKNAKLSSKFTGSASKRQINANFRTTGITGDFINDMNGEFNGSGTLKLNKNVSNSQINADFQIQRLSNEKWFNDTLDLIVNSIRIRGDKDISAAAVSITGKHINGEVSNLSLISKDEKNIFTFNFDMKAISLDSLIKPDTTAKKEADNKPYEIPAKFEGKISGICRDIEFKKESLKNLNVNGTLKNSILNAEFNGNMLNGDIDGIMKLSFSRNVLTQVNLNTKGIDAHRFLIKHKLFPYEVGGMILSSTDVSFEKERMMETIKGQSYVQITKGWMLAPSLLTEITEVIRYDMSDTFYFDTMTGIFDVDTQVVSFDDFYMEKNGHSITYSGYGDFSKNINVQSEYIIDMKIADTGFFERLLKSTDYPYDSIIVNFDIIGNFSKPHLNMKGNSINEYLKGKTQDFVDDFVDDLNNIFKF